MGNSLEALLEQKGIVSRKIGEAKREGKPIEALLSQMKLITAEIATIKNVESKAQDLGKASEEKCLQKPDKPGLFKRKQALSPIAVSKIVECDSGMAAKWDAYVNKCQESSIYHRWGFNQVVAQSFGHQTHYLAALDADDVLCGILPAVEMQSRLFGHFIVSLPYFTYGGVLADSEQVAQSLYQALFDLAKKQGVEHVELRATCSQPGLEKDMPAKLGKVSMVRALPDSAEQLWQEIGTKVRAQIKKAQRFDLQMKFGKEELLDDFYRVFAENMRDLGTPVYAKTFFSELIRSDLSASFDIGVMYFERKPVACCFLMEHQGMMEIPWASALNAVNDMNVNMLMYWEVLKRAISQENQFFDFGRSSKDAGTYRFKKQWGAKPQQLYWYYWLPDGGAMPELNPNNPKYKLLISVWQKLPVWLTKWIGPPVVKYLP